eukprot:c17974_g1_i2.p1 GENE.c17974_g1_i2~~c17974_g1_i2.p1  ORF type:complete len:481 (+),score=92.32 c17974_g1_i2:379-1821(+)
MRGYSDFVWLHDSVASTLPGVFVPPIPRSRKKIFWEKSGTRDKRVISLLNNWLRRIHDIPEILASQELDWFLHCEPNDFKVTAKAADKARKRDSRGAKDLKPVIEEIDATETHVDTSRVNKLALAAQVLQNAKEFLAALSDLEKNLKKVVDSVSKTEASLRGVQRGIVAMATVNSASTFRHSMLAGSLDIARDQLAGVADLEHEFVPALNHIIQDVHDFAEVMSSFVDFINNFLSQLRNHDKWRKNYEDRVTIQLINLDKMETTLDTKRKSVTAADLARANEPSANRKDNNRSRSVAQERLPSELQKHADYHAARASFEQIFRKFIVQCERFSRSRSVEVQLILSKLSAFWRNQSFVAHTSWGTTLDQILASHGELTLNELKPEVDPIPIDYELAKSYDGNPTPTTAATMASASEAEQDASNSNTEDLTQPVGIGATEIRHSRKMRSFADSVRTSNPHMRGARTSNPTIRSVKRSSSQQE